MRDAVSEFICDAFMWQRDAVSEIIWASTWLCSRAMRFQSMRLSTLGILDSQTHFKPTDIFQYTHLSSCHPFDTKKGFIKGEASRLLRSNSIKENFYKHKRDFEQTL